MTATNQVDPELALKLGQQALQAQGFSEAHHYFSSVLEVDPQNVQAIAGKGLAAGWQSNLIRLRVDEMMQSYREVKRLAGTSSPIFHEMVVQMVELFFAIERLSREHTMRFVVVDAARYESFDRAEELVIAIDEVLKDPTDVSDVLARLAQQILTAQINTSGCMGDQLARFKSKLAEIKRRFPEKEDVAKKAGKSSTLENLGAMVAAVVSVGVTHAYIQPTSAIDWIIVLAVGLFVIPLTIAGTLLMFFKIVVARREGKAKKPPGPGKSPGQV